MTRAVLAFLALAAVLVLLALTVGRWALQPDIRPVPTASSSTTSGPEAESHPPAATHGGFLYGRITTTDGATYEGRLRWGGDDEAFWSDHFKGSRDENPWAVLVPPDRLKRSRPVKVLGVEVADRERTIDLHRPFMARIGDIARIEARGADMRVTLKSGTTFDLDRYGADDLADGVRVWDPRGAVDIGERGIRTIELLANPSPGAAPYRVYGTVRTPQGAFTGFVHWNRREGVGTDTLDGRTAGGEVSVRFDTIRSIERSSGDGTRVTLLGGRELALSDTREVGRGNRGLFVDDPRYGRVLVFWDAFERVDLGPGGSGPAYGEFPPGHPLTGHVTTRAGRVLTGRLVYDLDESETTETLDAPSGRVHYAIPFGLIAAIAPEEVDARHAIVTLHGGEKLRLERSGDLGEGNAGMLIFADGRRSPEYLPWTDVEEIRLDRPPAMYPPPGGR